LGAESVQDRRVAARELATQHSKSRLSDAALLRLRELLERETDALVWNDVLVLIESDGRVAAADLAAIAASHPQGDVRRRACGYFGEHPSPRAAEVLLNSLADEDASVVREAIRSLSKQPALSDLTPLTAILTSADSELRLEAAAALARLGSTQGIQALLRITHHPDPAIRRRAATALGDAMSRSSHQPIDDALRQEATAELTRLLDDQGGVRRAAEMTLRGIEDRAR
jgi:HEAT repeat protein